MLFNSIQFAVFLPVVFMLFWLLPNKYRWVLLLISSYYFYMCWNVKYICLIFFTTAVSYTCAIGVEHTKNKKRKKLWLFGAEILTLGILFIFKYFNFISENIAALCTRLALPMHPITLKLLLPVGISFYTFQTLSYVIDVYRGDVPAEHHFGKFATFISFFPQLVAGPIERSSNLLPQISGEHSFSYDNATYGLKLMAWGFFKKIVISDTLAAYVDRIYGNLAGFSGGALLLAAVFFSFQIYCDFSGYSDIAIGTAALFDIKLMKNFKSPYFSASVKEFWSRWHISLSTWFRDYLYIPLGGNRCSKIRHRCNLMLTFLVSGLWHGANWTFLAWGGIHGLAQIGESLMPTKPSASRMRSGKARVTKGIKIVCVFIFCTAAWILFRADALSDAGYVFQHIFDGLGNPLSYMRQGCIAMGLEKDSVVEIMIMLSVLLIYDGFNLKTDVIQKIGLLKWYIRWPIYLIFIFMMLYLLPGQSSGQFIYFQF